MAPEDPRFSFWLASASFFIGGISIGRIYGNGNAENVPQSEVPL